MQLIHHCAFSVSHFIHQGPLKASCETKPILSVRGLKKPIEPTRLNEFRGEAVGNFTGKRGNFAGQTLLESCVLSERVRLKSGEVSNESRSSPELDWRMEFCFTHE